jgi:hypothetical protein
MIDTVVVAPRAGAGSSLAGVSWPAIFAGAVTACAMTLVLLAFGTGLGLSMVSPWAGAGISATTFKITTGIYLIVIAMISSSIGGYMAGRLRSAWDGVHGDEVYFRDTAHGFVAWALASLIGAAVLATPATSLIGGTAAGVSQGAVNSAAQSGPMDGYMDTLLRSDPAQSNNANPADTRTEMVRLFTRGFKNGGEIAGPDREYTARVVAAKTGLSQPDAEKRVSEVITQIKADADAARKATAATAFWITASLLLGAFCASLAATEGGGLRDGTWKRRR